jgi:hypothetical protein
MPIVRETANREESGGPQPHVVPIAGYDLLGYRAAVGAAPEQASRAVRSILRGFGPVDVGHGLDLPRYELVETAEGWVVRVNGEVVHTDTSFDPALSALEWHLVSTALGRQVELFHMHAAALCVPTQRAGILLAGNSGNGKTTLTLGLMLRGFVPFGDDVALLDPQTLELQPLRRAFHFDAQSIRVLEPLAGGVIRWDDTEQPGYFSPPQWATTRVPVRWVLFPEYQAGQRPELIPVSPSEAATAILTQTLSLARAPRLALSTATRLMKHADCFRFLTGDLEESVRVVQQLVATERNPAASES